MSCLAYSCVITRSCWVDGLFIKTFTSKVGRILRFYIWPLLKNWHDKQKKKQKTCWSVRKPVSLNQNMHIWYVRVIYHVFKYGSRSKKVYTMTACVCVSEWFHSEILVIDLYKLFGAYTYNILETSATQFAFTRNKKFTSRSNALRSTRWKIYRPFHIYGEVNMYALEWIEV